MYSSNKPDNFNRQVVIIDDDPISIQLISASFKALGWQNVDGQKSISDANSRIADCGPEDLIVLDLNMPDIDGLHSLRKFAEAGVASRIILASGESDQILGSAKKMAEMLGLNILAAVAKPVSLVKLREIIDTEIGPTPQPMVNTSENTQIDVERCWTEGRPRIFYQPKIDAKTIAVTGFESLLRWQHDDFGTVPAYVILDYVNKRNLLDDVTSKVVAEVLRDAPKILDDFEGSKISINLSIKSIENMDYFYYLKNKIEETSIEPKDIIFEITEQDYVSDPTRAIEAMTRLRLLGYGLSIDDFGTGFSSFSRLGDAPFSELKIDREFVDGIHQSSSKRAIFEACIKLARGNHYSTVAEGVETSEDFRTIISLGVDIVQGYYFSKPLPLEELSTKVRARQASELESEK